MKKSYIIGITGGSASGKTFFLESLLSRFSREEVCLISQDNYYKPKKDIPLDKNGIENFDLPESIDFDAYCKDIEDLQNGKEVKIKKYKFNKPNEPDEYIVLKPAPILVVEGLFVFHNQEVAKFLDLKVFIDAKEHIKLKRRIIRDNKERGYDLEDVLYRWEHHVYPSYQSIIENTKDSADLIIENNHSFEKGLDVLSVYMRNILNSGA